MPGVIHKGVELALETGNNLGLLADNFQFIIEDVAGELAETIGFEDFQVLFDKKWREPPPYPSQQTGEHPDSKHPFVSLIFIPVSGDNHAA